MSTFTQDLRSALRSLIRTPSLTAAVVVSLGLGIGANTTVFTWVQAILLNPFPGVHNPDSLLIANLQSRDGRPRSWSYPNYRDMRDRSRLAEMVGQDDLTISIAVAGQSERGFGGLVSGNYFQTMGITPAVGRLIGPEDDRYPGGHPVAVLSHAYWQRRFAGDPAIVGREVFINNTPMTVIGVTPEKFLGSFIGVASNVWVPMAMQPQMMGGSRLEARGHGWMQAFARLKPGVSREQAQAELAGIMTQLSQEYRDTNDGFRVKLARAWEAQFGAASVLASILAVLSIVVALVLLIACANVANLMLSRAIGRRREMAVRLSLGASRWHIVRQLLTEAVLLALLAGGLGALMAYWTSGVLMAFAPPTDIPINFGLRIDWQTMAYTAVLSIGTGVLFGLAPAWQASRPDTAHVLKEEAGRGTTGGRFAHRLRSGLVVAQVAVCLVLLVGAGLFTRSLLAARDITPGFDPSNMVVASVDLFPNGYTPETGRQFLRRISERLGALPGVNAVAMARQVPLGLGGTNSTGLEIDGYEAQPDEEVNIVYNVVSPRYFETMKIPITAGREFGSEDTQESERVLVINETMARRYWSNRQALGGRVLIGRNEHRVVGIARDIKYSQLSEDPRPHMYFPLEQSYTSNVVLHVRSQADAGATLAAIRATVRDLDPNLPIFDARSIQEHLRIAVFAQRMGANMLGAIGVLALVLAAIGLYGVIAYAVSQRTQEMGVRLALGAAPNDLLWMVLRQGVMLTLIGLAAGLALALGAVGFMRSLLPGIAPRDPVTFVGVPVLLGAIAVLAALIPARRAGAVDPVVALRYE